MYSSIHSLAHRAPASRTRVRWQPYGSLPTLSVSSSSNPSSSRSPSTCTNSPLSTAPSSPLSTPCDAEPLKQTQPIQQTPQPQQILRDAQPREKNKYALGLVDQAVKSLCDIWRPQDIPPVFLTTSRVVVPGTGSDPTIIKKLTTQTPPPSLFATGILTECESLSGSSNLMPMKGFVHEVLRRSRTSGSVLQTALCYLEAIRPRVSELAQSGEAPMIEVELADRITVATEAEIAFEAEFCIGTDTIIINESDDSMDTIRISDSYSGSTAVCSDSIEGDGSTLKKTKSPSPALAPLPPLPSPLLCPRRAFLASLILASKFTQDKCYSNRAWAKLSGLPPREIGRCERALGDALDWRLWVGKSSQSQSSPTASPALSVGRSLSRCRSESAIPSTPVESTGFLAGSIRSNASAQPVSPASSSSGRTQEHESGRNAGLRRAATLPAEAFAFSTDNNTQHSQPNHSRDHAVAQWVHGKSKPSDDWAMYSPEIASPDYPVHGFGIKVTSADSYASETSPATPGLTYSPTSTESSSGDRTIQMPFCDDKHADVFTPHSTIPDIPSENWPYLDHSPTGPYGPITVASLANLIGPIHDSDFVNPPFAISSGDAAFEFGSKHIRSAAWTTSLPYIANEPAVRFQ